MTKFHGNSYDAFLISYISLVSVITLNKLYVVNGVNSVHMLVNFRCIFFVTSVRLHKMCDNSCELWLSVFIVLDMCHPSSFHRTYEVIQ